MGKSFLDLIQGHKPERRPVWLMRQAGRYLPEYREIRAKSKNFLNMCLTPEIAAEITLQPIRRFQLDAAIIFADILLVPYALGRKLEFREGEGPVLETVTAPDDLKKLHYNPEIIHPVYEALRLVKPALPSGVTLIGFCGSPWTVACYMVDGNSAHDFAKAKQVMRDDPAFLQNLISVIIDASEPYLWGQIEAGAEVLQLFESWAGLLADDDFRRWVIEPTKELVRRLRKRMKDANVNVPLIGFPRAATPEDYALYVEETGIDVIGLDQAIDAVKNQELMKTIHSKNIVTQGNLDPALLVEGGERMDEALRKIVTSFGSRHIVNLGHGVVPQTPPDHVARLVDFVHELP